MLDVYQCPQPVDSCAWLLLLLSKTDKLYLSRDKINSKNYFFFLIGKISLEEKEAPPGIFIYLQLQHGRLRLDFGELTQDGCRASHWEEAGSPTTA